LFVAAVRRVEPSRGQKTFFFPGFAATRARRRRAIGKAHAIVAAMPPGWAAECTVGSIALPAAGGNIRPAAAIMTAEKIRNFPMRCRDLSAMTQDRSKSRGRHGI
jgi:hypothetical protein